MSEEQSPYNAPESNLVESDEQGEWGSVERALTGNYELSVGQVFSDAWAITKGVKRTFWLAFLLYFAVIMGVSFGFGFISQMVGFASAAPILFSVVNQLVLTIIIYPLLAGIMLMGIYHSAGRPIGVHLLFENWGKTLPLFISYILMTLLSVLGFILLVIPGIYLMVSYMLVIPLMVEKDMGVWEAMETSRKAITKKWFTVFLIMLCMGLLMFVSMLPILIGLIWTVPLSVLVMAVLYRTMFGVRS